MRRAFIETLTTLAEKDKRILLLTGDLGYTVIEPFVERFPERFFNAGVAEQNMVGLATGLAEAGYIPFVYSIVPFATLRAFEFIRNGPVMHQLPVRIVGVGGGVEYGHNGLTHYGVEDIGVLRTQPGLRIIVPADTRITRSALEQTWNTQGPCYYRLGKDEKREIAGLSGAFDPASVNVVREGADIALVALGPMAHQACAAATQLEARGVQAAVAVVSQIHPAPRAAIRAFLERFPAALSIEAHYVDGALGSLLAEVIAEDRLGCRLVRCGLWEAPGAESGSEAYLLDRFGLSPKHIAETAWHSVGEIRSK